jgi:serine/threonine-protein phosphatase PGAM5
MICNAFKTTLTLFILGSALLVSTYGQNLIVEEKGTRTIYLIRHGQYDEADERDSDVGKELVPLGIAQSRLLAARLKAMPINFNSLTSSTMTRARQTAMIINEDFPELELLQSTLIRECTPPTRRKDIMAETDSTELSECVNNLEGAFKEFFIPSPDKKDRNDIIVCHGNVIRYFVTKVLKVDTMAWLQMSIGNCSLTIVRISPDGSMKLAAFSDMGHIPPNLQTETGGNNIPKELVIPEGN